MNITKFETQATMTLKEITDLLDVRHNNAMRTVRGMFGELEEVDVPYSPGNGATLQTKTVVLTKYQALMFMARVSPELGLQAIVKLDFDLMTVMEALDSFEVPDDLPDMYVYAIRNTETGNVKIGISKHPELRVKQLQVGSDAPLELVATRKAVNRYKDERLLHDVNKDCHLIGEWFDGRNVVFQ